MIDRRSFLRTAVGGAMFAPSLAGLIPWNDRSSLAAESMGRRGGRAGFGELVPSVDCPQFMIPKGFRCLPISLTHFPSTVDAAFTVPAAVDGMAAFALPNGNVRLIRNHEVGDDAERGRAFGSRPYDPKAAGGTTSLEVRITGSGTGRGVELVREFPSLSGTLINCAGGSTPWGSWLSCEETTQGTTHGYAKPHGYIFEVPVNATSEVDPVPLKAMGRFVHEAVAVDPRTGFVYMTEDVRWQEGNPALPGSGFYRFIPNTPGRLADGGRVQILAVRDQPRYSTIRNQQPGVRIAAHWIDIENADPAEAETDPSFVFRGGYDRGAALFQRLEGAFWADDCAYFDSTSGGNAGAGQIWQYRPTSTNEGELSLVFESPSPDVLDSPDNLCTTKHGGLIICEDGAGDEFLRGLTREGEMVDIARAPVMEGKPAPTEFAGCCFSPDYSVLFFNQQGSTRSYGSARGGTYALIGDFGIGGL